jgi:hypothetical protein
MKFQSFAQLGDADLINISVKLFQNIESVRYRLNDVIGFLPAKRVSSFILF